MSWWRRPSVRVAFLLAAFGFLGWAFSDQWREYRAVTATAARDRRIAWPWVLLASLIVLATHALLVQSWRQLLFGWGGVLGYRRAVAIWTIANLGKWIPGKFWQVGVMGSMAADHGISPVAATGAAVLGTLLNVGAGFGIASVTGAAALDTIHPGLALVARGAAVAFLIGVLALPWVLPRVLDLLARWRRVPVATQQLTARDVWLATVLNAAAWIGYGLAFACFARGVTTGVSGDPALFVAVYTASYLIGYLALISPGGLGFREVALVAFLVGTGAAGKGDATILSVMSRVWLTVLEVLPGLLSLLLLSPVQRMALRRRD